MRCRATACGAQPRVAQEARHRASDSASDSDSERIRAPVFARSRRVSKMVNVVLWPNPVWHRTVGMIGS